MPEDRLACDLGARDVRHDGALTRQGDLAGQVVAHPEPLDRPYKLLREPAVVLKHQVPAQLVHKINPPAVHVHQLDDPVQNIIKNVLGPQRLGKYLGNAVYGGQLPVLLGYLVVKALAVGHVFKYLHDVLRLAVLLPDRIGGYVLKYLHTALYVLVHRAEAAAVVEDVLCGADLAAQVATLAVGVKDAVA